MEEPSATANGEPPHTPAFLRIPAFLPCRCCCELHRLGSGVLVPVVRVTGVLPQLRTLKLEGALMSYHSFFRKGSNLCRRGKAQDRPPRPLAELVQRGLGALAVDELVRSLTLSFPFPSCPWTDACSCRPPSAKQRRRAALRCEPQASGRCAAGWCRALRRRAEARRGSGRAAGVLRSRSCRGGRRWAAQGTAVCRTSSDRLRLRQRRGWGGNCCSFTRTFAAEDAQRAPHAFSPPAAHLCAAANIRVSARRLLESVQAAPHPLALEPARPGARPASTAGRRTPPATARGDAPLS